MPRSKKRPRDMTSEELAKKLFPKKLRDEIKKRAELDSKPTIKKNGSTE